nr:hypothetical protein [Tanacetum cinerariifolium]
MLLILMTSFGYPLNPCYAIKECSSCGALYTRDCWCSNGNVEDKILVPKPPKSCARCARCGHPVDGPYCQGCALLRKKLKEDLEMVKSVNDVLARGVEVVLAKDFVIFVEIIKILHKVLHISTTIVAMSVELDNSLSMGDEHLETIPAIESDEVIKSSVEDLVPIPSESKVMTTISTMRTSSMLRHHLTILELVSLEVAKIVILEDEEIKDDNLREKLLNVNLLIAKIEALKDNPTPSFEFLTKSSSISPNSFLEENNTFDNSLLEFETFCFDVEEISSGSTITHFDISLPEYEAFYDDHVKEISSGSPTTHSDSSLYASLIFDLSINPFPPADRSDFYEFADELIHFISPPEYDCFYFKIEPNSGDFTMDVVEDISPTKELRVHNALPTHPTLQLNLNF